MDSLLQVARLAGIEGDIVAKARLAGQHIEDKLQVIDIDSSISRHQVRADVATVHS